MRAGQREPVHVLANLLNGNFPAADGMTRLAGCAHLRPMNVGMAVRALVADIAEDHLGVAGAARYSFMHPA